MTGGLLRQRAFRSLWTADLLSQFGDRVSVLAVPLLAAETLGASAFEVSSLRTVQTLAYLVLGLQVGAWCDRIRVRPMLIGTDLGRFVAYGSVPLAAFFGGLTLWQLFVVVAVAGVLAVFFEVGHQTYLPRLVRKEELVEGNARLQTNLSVSAVAAPVAGGYIVQYLGGAIAIGANALSFLWSAFWLGRIRVTEPVPVRPAREPLRRQIGEGLAFLLRHRILRPLAEATLLVSLFQAVPLALGTLFLLREIGLSPATIGLVSTTGLVGAVLAAVSSRRLGRRVGEARLLWGSGVLIAIGYVLVALTRPGWALACYPVGNVVVTFAITATNVVQVSFQQTVTPPHLVGRVNATMRFLILGAAPLGSLAAGAVASAVGLRTAFWICAAGMVLAALRLVASPLLRMRGLPDTYPEPEPGSTSA